MIIFPAIDILDGQCVRLRQGKYDEITVYAEDPSEMARFWEAGGAEWLHVVDLDGARDGHPVNLASIEKIANKVGLAIQLGGGVRSEADIRQLFEIGVSRAVLGTSLVSDEDFATKAIGAYGENLAAGIDGRYGKVAVSGWREDTDVEVRELAAHFQTLGVSRIIYTDITVDGTRKGPNIAATKMLAEGLDIPVIASGGVSSLADITALREIEGSGVEGVIIGSALYEKSFSLADALEAAAD